MHHCATAARNSIGVFVGLRNQDRGAMSEAKLTDTGVSLRLFLALSGGGFGAPLFQLQLVGFGEAH